MKIVRPVAFSLALPALLFSAPGIAAEGASPEQNVNDAGQARENRS